MKIAVIGVGYVGLVTANCLAKLGNNVVGIDNDSEKIKKLKKGIMPIYEEGLDKLLKENIKKKKISFTNSIAEGIQKAEIVFICVGTPPKPNGDADLSSVENCSREIAENMKEYKLIVGKSTVPVNTGEWIKRTVKLYNRKNIGFDVASNPEFLREGTAVNDFLCPDRIVIGVESEMAKKLLLDLYETIKAPKLITNIQTAELIKHASNSFLAMKISYINALANICEKTGADITKIAEGMGYDKRIGRAFLNAGPGYGGFCFPKDVSAFIYIAEKTGYNFELLKSVEKINEIQKKSIVKKIEETLWILKGKTVGVLGLSFKPNTDDIRFSPAMEIVGELIKHKVKVKAYDPVSMDRAKKELPELVCCKDSYDVCKDSNALVILTDWEEFKDLDLKKIKKFLKTPIFIDSRNLYNPEELTKLGFIYKGVGR